MNVQPVSLGDPRLAPYVNLHQTNLTRGSGLFVVEGPLLVERLLASDFEVASLLVDERFVDALPAGLSDSAAVYVVPAGQIERVIGFNFHRGMLACGRRPPTQPLAELLRPDPEDYFVLKPKHSAFFATTMDTLLRYLGARTLIVTGIATDICVLFSANDAYMRDYELIVPSDCVAANCEEDNQRALQYIERVLKADIRPSTAVDLIELKGE